VKAVALLLSILEQTAHGELEVVQLDAARAVEVEELEEHADRLEVKI
jgi:hypothetical protein